MLNILSWTKKLGILIYQTDRHINGQVGLLADPSIGPRGGLGGLGLVGGTGGVAGRRAIVARRLPVGATGAADAKRSGGGAKAIGGRVGRASDDGPGKCVGGCCGAEAG